MNLSRSVSVGQNRVLEPVIGVEGIKVGQQKQPRGSCQKASEQGGICTGTKAIATVMSKSNGVRRKGAYWSGSGNCSPI